MALIKADIVTEARKILKDPSTGTIWTSTSSALEDFVDTVAKELAKREPLKKYVILPVIEYTTEIDVSGQTYLDIRDVEYPIGNSGLDPVFVNYDLLGTRLIMRLSDDPTIEATTLTGTLVFTKDSRTVTGTGSKFLSELTYGVNGDVIGASAGTKYYQVAGIVSDTSLVLREPFEETTVTDVLDSTKCRDRYSCAKIYLDAYYSVSTTTNAPTHMDTAFIAGVAAHAMRSWVNNYAQGKMTDITTQLGSAVTAIAYATARIVQSVTDVGTFRTNLGTDLTSFTNGLTDIAAALTLAEADLVNARAKIPLYNAGGDEASKYIESGKTELGQAQGHLNEAMTYSDRSKIDHQYLDVAEGELKAVQQSLTQASQYLNQVQQSVTSNYFVMSYSKQADQQWMDYEREKSQLGYVEDGFHSLNSRD